MRWKAACQQQHCSQKHHHFNHRHWIVSVTPAEEVTSCVGFVGDTGLDPPQPTAVASPARITIARKAVKQMLLATNLLRMTRSGNKSKGSTTNAEVEPGKVPSNTTVIW
jgi:hypothetical protein